MKVPVHNTHGEQVDEVVLAPSVFEIEPNIPVMHQAYVRQMANARAGTQSAQTRAEVNRTGAKVWRQKGTGRARQGSRRAPQWVGGGVIFAPKPRDYSKKMPKKMRRLAIRSALAAKAQAGRLIVIDELVFDQPSTKEMADVLGNVNIGDNSAVVLVGIGDDENVKLSINNLSNVKALHWRYINMRDVLGHDYLVVPLPALKEIEALWGEEA